MSELVGLLADRKLVAVIGPSGSGKSSLVHAGLIPAVRAGALDDASNWVVADMFPGSYPLEELESALGRVAVEDPGVLMDELENDDRGLSRVIKRILPANTRLLLVIDQFEELFTLTHDEMARSRLLAALVSLAYDERSDTRVVLTLRADFFDRPLQYPEFGELLKRGIVALTIPTDDELIDAIERPAEVVGASWEPGLPQQILADVGQAPGTLPLLQYALTELFTARTGHELTHQVYQQNGGVLGVLSARAEEALARLDPSQQALARQLFLRMVTVRSAGEATRRRARLVELNALGDPGEVGTVLDTFGGARLLVFDRDPISRSPTAEVAHEALLTQLAAARLGGSTRPARICFFTVVCEMGWPNGRIVTARTDICSRVVGWPSSTPGRAPPTSPWPPPRSISSKTAARRLTGNGVAGAGDGT